MKESQENSAGPAAISVEDDAPTPVQEPNIDDIRLGISLLFTPTQLVELRVSTADAGWRGFFFDDPDRLAETVAKLDDDPRVVSLYYVINPVNPSFIRERAKCPCEKCKGGGLLVKNPTSEQIEQILTGPTQHLTGNEDIFSLQNMLIDFDTIRASHLKLDETTKVEFNSMQHESSTDEEKKVSLETRARALEYLAAKGWPVPLLADSGNGYHAVARVNMLNTAHNLNLLADVRKVLKARFDKDGCKIDGSTNNASRLTRAYGTMTRKGTDTPERPFRRNRMFHPTAPITEVDLNAILMVSDELPGSGSCQSKRGKMPVPRKDFDPQNYFDWFANKENHPRRQDDWKPAFEIVGERESAGVTYYITDICLNVGHKHTGSVVTGFGFGDSFGYKCFSDDCEGITLKDLHSKLREEGYERYPEPIFEEPDPVDEALEFGAAVVEGESLELPPQIFPLTDIGNAERLAFRYGGKFVHTEATGWMVYEGGVWNRDKTGSVVRAMHRTVRLIEKEAELVDTGNEESDGEISDAIIGWGKKSESSAKIKAALEQAAALDVFARDYADFDQQPDLLNVANGTIDLKTFEFMPHDPSHLLTKQSAISYDSKAACPKWEQFIRDIMDGKEHMRDYLQRGCGYTLTADTSGQCFFMPWGTGGTGKSTMLHVLRGVMGTYCKQADAEMFMVKRGDSGQPFEMAGMEGVRLLMAIETEEGKKLALAKLKRMTGQDPITACYKFQHQYEFVPQWKVWLATNDAPTTRADDDAFWDRAKPIPFEVKFRNTDKEIKDYADILLREEGSGILNWCLEGLRQYREKGLAHPEDVAQKADEWRDRDDWLARFIEEVGLEPTDDREKFVSKHDLWSAFSRWSEQTKQAKNIDEKAFSQAMRRKGYDDEKPIKRDGKTVRVWHRARISTLVERGVGKIPDAEDMF